MNYTENYHLPQWEETDRIMRTDFNRMCADMEAGLNQNAQAAAAAKARGDKGVTDAAAAKAAADSAKSAAQTAQSSANRAQASADAAQKTADAAFCPSKLPYATGSYTGNGGYQVIELGFRARFVIISGMMRADTSVRNLLAAGPGVLPDFVGFLSNGFCVNQELTTEGNVLSPSVNTAGKLYTYIAFQ